MDPSRLDQTLSKWSVPSGVVCNDYEFIEPIVSQRCVLLQLLLDRSPAESDHVQGGSDRVHAGLLKQLCQLARLSREAGRHQVGGAASVEVVRVSLHGAI